MAIKLDIPDPFETESAGMKLDIPDPFDEAPAPAPPPEKKGLSYSEGIKEGYKQTGRLLTGAAEGITRGVQGVLDFGTALIHPEAPAPEQYKPVGLPTRKGYKRVLGVDVAQSPEEVKQEQADISWRQQNPGFNSPTEKKIITGLRKGASGLKQTADALHFMRTGTSPSDPELPPAKTPLSIGDELKQTLTGKIMEVTEGFSPLAGQMAMAGATGGGSAALGLQAFGSTLAESEEAYKQLHPGATDVEARTAAAPGALITGGMFTAMGGVTNAGRKILGKYIPSLFGKTAEELTNYGVKEAAKDLAASIVTDVPYMEAQGIAVGKAEEATRVVKEFNIKDQFTWENTLTNVLTVLGFKAMGLPKARSNAKELKSVLENPALPMEQRLETVLQVHNSLASRGEKKLAEEFLVKTLAKFKGEVKPEITTGKEVEEALAPTIAKMEPVKEKEVEIAPKEEAKEKPQIMPDLGAAGKAIGDNFRVMLLDAVEKNGKLPSIERKSDIGKAYEAKIAEGKPRTKETLLEVFADLEGKPAPQETAKPEEFQSVLRTPEGEIVVLEPGITPEDVAADFPGAKRGYRTAEGEDVFEPEKSVEPEAKSEPKVKVLESNPNIGVVEEAGEVKIFAKDAPGEPVVTAEVKDGKVKIVESPGLKKEDVADAKSWLKEAGYEVEAKKAEAKAKPEKKVETPSKTEKKEVVPSKEEKKARAHVTGKPEATIRSEIAGLKTDISARTAEVDRLSKIEGKQEEAARLGKLTAEDQAKIKELEEGIGKKPEKKEVPAKPEPATLEPVKSVETKKAGELSVKAKHILAELTLGRSVLGKDYPDETYELFHAKPHMLVEVKNKKLVLTDKGRVAAREMEKTLSASTIGGGLGVGIKKRVANLVKEALAEGTDADKKWASDSHVDRYARALAREAGKENKEEGKADFSTEGKAKKVPEDVIKKDNIMTPAVRMPDGKVHAGELVTGSVLQVADAASHPRLHKIAADDIRAKGGGDKSVQDRLNEIKDNIENGYRLPNQDFISRQDAFLVMEKEGTNELGNVIPGSTLEAYVKDQRDFLYRPQKEFLYENKDNPAGNVKNPYYKWTQKQLIEDMRTKGLESVTYMIAKGLVVQEGSAEFSTESKKAYYEKLTKGEELGTEPRAVVPDTAKAKEDMAKLEAVVADAKAFYKNAYGKDLPENAIQYVPESPNKETSQVAKLAKEAGINVIYFNTKKGLKGEFGAYINHNDPGTIFLNEKSSNPVIELLGHEWGHRIQDMDPGLWVSFIKEASKYTVKDLSKYAETHERYAKNEGMFGVAKEFWADVWGHAMGKESFWGKLKVKHPETFGKLVNNLLDFAATLSTGRKAGIAEIEKYFVDFDGAVDAAVRVLDADMTRRQVEKVKPIFDTKGNVVSFSTMSDRQYTKTEREALLAIHMNLGDMYKLSEKEKAELEKMKAKPEAEFSTENAVKVLKDKKKELTESSLDLVTHFFYPPLGVKKTGKNRFGEYRGEQALVQDQFKERVRGITNKIRNESFDSWVQYNDALRSGGEIPEVWREYHAIGKTLGDAVFDRIVEVYPEMESLRRDYHNGITLHWQFGEDVDPSSPFLGLSGGLRGDKSFTKKYSGKTVSQIIEEGGILRDKDPISTMARTLEAQTKFAASGAMVKNGVAGDWKYFPGKVRQIEGMDEVPPEIGEVHKKLLNPPSGWDVRDADGKKVNFFEDKANAEEAAKEIGGKVTPGGGAEYVKSVVVLSKDGSGEPKVFPDSKLAKDFMEKNGGEASFKTETHIGRKTSEVAGHWYAPKEEVRLLKNYLSVDKIRRNAIGEQFIRTVNAVKAIELFSTFHFSTITQEIVACRLGLMMQHALQFNGKALLQDIKGFEGAISLGTMARSWLKDPDGFATNPETQAKLRRYIGEDAAQFGELATDLYNAGLILHQDPTLKYGERQGVVGKTFDINTARRGWDIVKDGKADHVIIGGMKVPMDVVKGLQGLLFEHYIPNAKFSIAMMHYTNDLHQYAGQIERKTRFKKDLAREAVAFAEKRMGEVNWQNLGFDKTYKTLLQMFFRAPTWKAGTIAAFATSGIRLGRQFRDFQDAWKNKERPAIDKDVAWLPGILAAHIMGSMMIGYGAAWITGNEDLKPEKVLDYFFPKIGLMFELATGQKKYRRAAQPGYATEAAKLAHDIYQDPVHLPIKYLTGGLNSYFGKVGDVYKNQDFFGNQVYDEEDTFLGRQWSKAQHLAPLPFGVTTAKQASQMEEGPVKWIYMTGLFQKAPAWATHTFASAKMQEYLSGHTSKGGFTKEEAEENKMRTNIMSAIRKGAKSFEDFSPEVQKALTTMDPARAKRIVKSAAQPPVVTGFAKLKIHEATTVWGLMTPEEKQATAEGMVKHIITRYKHVQNDPERLEVARKKLDPILMEIQGMFGGEEEETP